MAGGPSTRPKSVVSAPKQDPVSENQTYIGANGAKLPEKFLRTTVARVDRAFNTSFVKLGNKRHVLPASKISVINIWATYCGPCKKELPGFKKMFRANAEAWGRDVRFAAVKLSETVSPDDAYAKFDSKMPTDAYWFSARSEAREDEVLAALQHPAADEAKLYYGNVPITMVLDCNRRVRWARFKDLKKKHFQELAGTIDLLVAELDTKKCKQTWCGNGRCEDGESEASCRQDCGSSEDDVDGLAKDAPAEKSTRDPDCYIDEKGQKACLARPEKKPTVRKTDPKPPEAECGNLACERDLGEDCHTCLADCPCPENLSCMKTAVKWHCTAGLAKG